MSHVSHVLVIFRVPGSLTHGELETLRAGLEALAFRNGIELDTLSPVTPLTLKTIFARLMALYEMCRSRRRTHPKNTPPTAA